MDFWFEWAGTSAWQLPEFAKRLKGLGASPKQVSGVLEVVLSRLETTDSQTHNSNASERAKQTFRQSRFLLLQETEKRAIRLCPGASLMAPFLGFPKDSHHLAHVSRLSGSPRALKPLYFIVSGRQRHRKPSPRSGLAWPRVTGSWET